jgi:alanine racemase
MLSSQEADQGVFLVNSSSDIPGSLVYDTIVKRRCCLHVRGNLRGSLTIEAGAKVVVDGSVEGKIINRGGHLVVHHKGLAGCVTVDGPPEAEAGGVLKINLTAIASNWAALTKRTEAECAAVVAGDAYGCGIEPLAGALTASGCRTFFVSNLAEAKRLRAVAPSAIIYVLRGLYSGGGSAFAEINARPVINSLIEMAEWHVFVTLSGWAGDCALNVDTGVSRLGLSVEETVALAPRVQTARHGISLLMSRLDNAEIPHHPQNELQIAVFRDLRRLYQGVPASLANSSGIFNGPKVHCDLVRAGGALYGVNPTPGCPNPMQPVVELKGRIVQVRSLARGETIADNVGLTAKRRTRIALVSVGYADGYPRTPNLCNTKLQAIVGGQSCPIAGPPSMDLLPVDVTDLPDPTAARHGEMVTLIGPEFGIDDLAAATNCPGRELLSHLGRRFHRIYYAL